MAFLVLHTTSPDGVQKVWTEIGMASEASARDAWRTVLGATSPSSGTYKVLPIGDPSDSLTITVQTTIAGLK